MSGIVPGADAEYSDAIDPSTFVKTLSPSDVLTRIRPGDILHWPPFFFPIDTISPTHTVGKGRTNLTLIASDIMQTDTTGTPYASFSYRQVPSGGPGVSVHFDPGAYGATAVASYVIEFLIATSGPVSLTVGGYAGAGSVTGAGVRTVNGNVSVSVGLGNVPPGQITYASIQQTSSGPGWQWFSTSIEHPPLVFEP
ncbi:hypothetical protein [Leifsonia shinshuensis]|uniref:Uncharacterized protein n=1 Tax=Leifsonia shinshuensis TaxID=150026 RepID=A0A7G6Y5G2_9MICO|nr:hypothetical protein [Leifsonia shinshuensis]QNE33727.1 hypothetical protein F1C12_00245 [Leifsonia shinshuensis]